VALGFSNDIIYHVVFVLLYYDKSYFVPPPVMSFANSATYSALILFILEPRKQLYLPEIYNKTNVTAKQAF